jgi:acyl carrier protein
MKTEQEIIINTISLYLKKIKGKEIEVNLNSKLFQDLELDSLDAVELALYIKQEFDLQEFDIFEMMKCQLTTVEDVISFFKNLNDKQNK